MEIKDDKKELVSKKIMQYYMLTYKLKDLVRSGWKCWHVKKERLESVAEHIYGTCMLAIGIWSETLPQVNLAEVLMTLAIHETEEIIIGDLTPFDAGYSTKQLKGEKAVYDIFKGMVAKDVFVELIKNFDNGLTPEGIFAKKCDKLECDIQAKIYDEQGLIKLENADDKVKNSDKLEKLKQRGIKNPASFFIYSDRPYFVKNADDEENDIFLDLSRYIERHKITQLN